MKMFKILWIAWNKTFYFLVFTFFLAYINFFNLEKNTNKLKKKTEEIIDISNDFNEINIEKLIDFLNKLDKNYLENFRVISLKGSKKKIEITGEVFVFAHLEHLLTHFRKSFETVLLSSQKQQKSYYFKILLTL